MQTRTDQLNSGKPQKEKPASTPREKKSRVQLSKNREKRHEEAQAKNLEEKNRTDFVTDLVLPYVFPCENKPQNLSRLHFSDFLDFLVFFSQYRNLIVL